VKAKRRRAQRRSVPSELPILSDYYRLLTWSYERAEGFPKVLRPSLTHRFLALLLEGLETLLELRYSREREPLFRATNLCFEKLRFLSRALKDRRALSLGQYEHFNRQLNAVGQQLGGWRKACARRAAPR
jgi:hypothetical protein